MKLLIVESPTKAKNISQYLGGDYYVMSSYGHVRAIPSKSGAVRPGKDFETDYEVVKKSEKYINLIIERAKRSSVIYLATDPDREGESISWHIADMIKDSGLGSVIEMKRVFFHEITKKSVLEAVNNPRNIDMNLVYAQQTRQVLDYLVGFNISPLLWRKLPGSKSAGRVQSVALKLICAQEDLIRDFKKKEYWTLNVLLSVNSISEKSDVCSAYILYYLGNKVEKDEIESEVKADEIITHLNSEKKYIVDKITKKVLKKSPYPPFHTSSLLQEASAKLGFSASRTMKVAQKLYEGIAVNDEIVSLITYMRTDSFNISPDVAVKARNVIISLYGDKYALPKPRFFKTKTKNAQEAHEAIRPTDVSIYPNKIRSFLSDDEFRLYDIIWRRFIACQMQYAEIQNTTITAYQFGNIETVLKISGSITLFDGFQKIYNESGVNTNINTTKIDSNKNDSSDEDTVPVKEQILPQMSEGDTLYLRDIVKEQHFTKMPPRYNEGSLIKKLESLGIGRPSTYSTIINTILKRDYVVKQGRALVPESRGELVNAFLCTFFSRYVEYNFTADLENILDEIASNNKNYKEVLKDFWVNFKENVDEVFELKTRYILDNLEKIFVTRFFETDSCPNCSNGVIKLKNGRFGSFFACSSFPDCKYTFNFSSSNSSTDVDTKEYPILLGSDDNFGIVSINKGPYGLYVQGVLGENIKRVSIKSKKPVSEITCDYAVSLLKIPYSLGKDDDSNDVILNQGKYGPYIQYKGENYRVSSGIDIFSIDLEKAFSIIYRKKKAGGKKISKSAISKSDAVKISSKVKAFEKKASEKKVVRKAKGIVSGMNTGVVKNAKITNNTKAKSTSIKSKMAGKK